MEVKTSFIPTGCKHFSAGRSQGSGWLSQGFSPSCEVPAAREEMLQDFLVRGRGRRAVDFPLCVIFHKLLEEQPLPMLSIRQNCPKHSCSSSLKRKGPRKTGDFCLGFLIASLFSSSLLLCPLASSPYSSIVSTFSCFPGSSLSQKCCERSVTLAAVPLSTPVPALDLFAALEQRAGLDLCSAWHFGEQAFKPLRGSK